MRQLLERLLMFSFEYEFFLRGIAMFRSSKFAVFALVVSIGTTGMLWNIDGSRLVGTKEASSIRGADLGDPGDPGAGWILDNVCGIRGNCVEFSAALCSTSSPCPTSVNTTFSAEHRFCAPSSNPFPCECRQGGQVACASFSLCALNDNGDCVSTESTDIFAGMGCEYRCFP